jgi:phospholipid/cholesterol/gamma-HCH transport system ATP-binding protein
MVTPATATATATVVEAKGIVNRFGAQAVHDGLDLTLEKGEIHGIVGGSGSGKSVLLRTLLGLNRPAQGSVSVAGRDIAALSEEERRGMAWTWGVLFQDGALFSGLDTLDNIGLPLREHTALDRREVEDLSLHKLRLVGLGGEAARKMPSELSGGMVRRVGLARALALDPAILFLDEPTSGLDPVSAAGFDELIAKLREVMGLSVLLITHDLDTLAAICDRISMLVDRKAVTGTLADMMAAEHPAIKEFFQGPRMRAVNTEPARKAGHKKEA